MSEPIIDAKFRPIPTPMARFRLVAFWFRTALLVFGIVMVAICVR